MTGDFLLAAQLVGAGAARASLSSQVRTPMWPSPPGAPDRAMVRLDTASLEDMKIPGQFDIEVIADPDLAVIPPLGNALRTGGLLLVNAPSPPPVPADGPSVAAIDMTALAAGHGASPGYALAGAAWAVLGAMAPEMALPLEAIEGADPPMRKTPTEESEKALLREAHRMGSEFLVRLNSQRPPGLEAH
ncbi:MAG TPA: hypothetical protein DDZ83_18785 [Nitrospinae bacterium]|nr:hypothetical protein [Nitrospinota bacterium]